MARMRVVIIGCGFGGLECAKKLDAGPLDVLVVDRHNYFVFTPLLYQVASSLLNPSDIAYPVRRVFSGSSNVRFRQADVTGIDFDARRLRTAAGDSIPYDYLVISTGPHLAFEEVPGAGPKAGHTESVCTTDHAEHALAAYRRFIEEPGPAIIGAMPGASCFGPAYEFAFIFSRDLQKRRIRHKVPITFVTPEPYIGHLGLAGVGDSKGMLESELRNHDVKWICNAKVTKVEAGRMFVTELDDLGQVRKEHELPFSYSMMLPAFRGVAPVAGVEGLCNPRGFVLIDEHQRSKKYKNIFSAGVCVAIPPVEATAVPTGAPKTGYMIESTVTAIVHNIVAELRGQPATAKGAWNAICLADMGDTGAAFVALPQIPPRNVNWFRKGKWVHLAKIAFEKYFLYKMRTGSSEPVYEKYVLKALGITRLIERK